MLRVSTRIAPRSASGPIRRDLPAEADFGRIAAAVRDLNEDPACTGFIVQLPLPSGVDENAIIGMIDPAKDADGMHPYNLGELVLHVNGAVSTPLPCTPRGVLALLDHYGIGLDGKHVCVAGARHHHRTYDRAAADPARRQRHGDAVPYRHAGHRGADASGRRHHRGRRLGWVRPPGLRQTGAPCSWTSASPRVWDETPDASASRGDVDPACYELASAYTPNPGGVGPMTRAMLLANVVDMAERAAR